MHQVVKSRKNPETHFPFHYNQIYCFLCKAIYLGFYSQGRHSIIADERRQSNLNSKVNKDFTW